MSCANCSPAEFWAERKDVLKTAYAVLKEMELEGDDPIRPEDITEFARFLSGE